jgi:hypothetical protein
VPFSEELFKSAWTATIEVGMATWAVFRKHKSIQNPRTQAKMEATFKREWCKKMYLRILMLLFNGISYLIWFSLILPTRDFLNEFTHEPYHYFLVTIDVTTWDFSFFINFIFRDTIHLILREWFQPPFFVFISLHGLSFTYYYVYLGYFL